MQERQADIVVVGAGILGLAHAYFAARSGKSVAVLERSPRASGASVRNFGMIWPIGQPPGVLHEMALRSRETWQDVLLRAGLPHVPNGSLHVIYGEDEEQVAREFAELGPAQGYPCQWLAPAAAMSRSPLLNPAGLRGALWSGTELSVDPPLILARLPEYLNATFDVQFRFGRAVRRIDPPFVEAGLERWRCATAIVCSGDDFETLFPELLSQSGLVRCKLQMMRTTPCAVDIGPSLAAGLTLRFYPSFRICPSRPALARHVAETWPEYDKWGIHVMVSQNQHGELILGDSHEDGNEVDFANKEEIDSLILRYLTRFIDYPDLRIAARWHGVYAKHPEHPFVRLTPCEGVTIVTGAGGSGMTLSFAIAEQTLNQLGVISQ